MAKSHQKLSEFIAMFIKPKPKEPKRLALSYREAREAAKK